MSRPPRAFLVLLQTVAGPTLEAEALPDDLIVVTNRIEDSFFWPDQSLRASTRAFLPIEAMHVHHQIKIPPCITNRYRNAVETFAPLVAQLAAKHVVCEGGVCLIVAASDLGVRSVCPEKLPPGVRYVEISYRRHQVEVAVHFDDPMLPRGARPPTAMPALVMMPGRASLMEQFERAMASRVMICVWKDRNQVPDMPAGWQQFKQHSFGACERCTIPYFLTGPFAELDAQLARIRRMANIGLRPVESNPARLAVCEVPVPYQVAPVDCSFDLHRCYCNRKQQQLASRPDAFTSYRWPAVKRWLVELVMVLTAAHAGLVPYVLLWIADMVPGLICFPDIAKLRTIESTLRSIARVRSQRQPNPHH